MNVWRIAAWALLIACVVVGFYYVYPKIKLYHGRFDYHSQAIMELKERVETLEEKSRLCPESKQWNRGGEFRKGK